MIPPLPCRTSTATLRPRFGSFSPGQQVPVCPQGTPASDLGCHGSTMCSSNLSCSVNPSTTGSWVLILFISHRTYRRTDDSSVTPFCYVFLEGKDRDIPDLTSPEPGPDAQKVRGDISWARTAAMTTLFSEHWLCHLLILPTASGVRTRPSPHLSTATLSQEISSV